MSRWFDRLNALRAVSDLGQIGQNGQKVADKQAFGQFDHIVQITETKTEKFTERASIIQANGIPREWADGFAALCTMPRSSYFTETRWQQLVDDGGCFLDTWGRQAANLGWQAEDVFGVNPDAPEWRYDCMGLLPLLMGRRVIAITQDTARIDCGRGVTSTYRRLSGCSVSVCLWRLMSSAQT